MKTQFNIKKSLFNDYDTVLFDLDLTIFNGFSPKGESIPAMALEPPLNLVDENTVKDSKGNVIKLQADMRDVLDNLDEYGLNLGVVSASAVPDVADEAQPAIMVLKKLDIYKYFTYIVIVKPKINKGDYARPFGKTLFIDDDPEQIQAVNTRGLVDVLNRKTFVNWADLFPESKAAKPKPTSLQTAVNAPQPTTSSWAHLFRQLFSFKHQADPLTYTDKSDIDEGIGGGSKNKADMWHMEDHLTLDNGRDHVWGEPWEPMRQFFLDENVTPTLEDKIKQQHPDKGGIANSSLKFAVEEALPQNNPVYDEEAKALIREIADYLVYDYIQHHDLDVEDAVTILLPTMKQYLIKEHSMSDVVLLHYAPVMEQEITEAAKSYISIGEQSHTYREPEWDKETLAQIIQDFLLKKFNHEQFSLESLVRMVDTYVSAAQVFPPNIIAEVIQSLPSQFPESFTQNGNLIYIGDIKQKPIAEKIALNVDELKDVALKPIEEFAQYGDAVTKTKDGLYIYKDNGSDILAVAHLDTRQDLTHFEIQNLDDTRVIRNAQLDDRLGAYVILKLLPQLGVNVDILLTEGEETGHSTARYFQPTKQYKWVFSFDRMGMDTVMYQYHDKATEDLLNSQNFTVGQGSFSDIAFLEHLGVKGFNFGVGYYDNHARESNAIESHVLHNIRLFKDFYDKYKNQALPHTDTGYFKKRFSKLIFSDNPKAEQYPDYMGNTDVSPLDPKTKDDKERDDSIRTDLQKMYYGWGTHETVIRPETDRALTPFAGLKFGDVLTLPYPFAIGASVIVGKLPEYKSEGFFGTIIGIRGEWPTSDNEWLVSDTRGFEYVVPAAKMRLLPHNATVVASMNFDQPIHPELHKPNAIMRHEAVEDALTFAESVKSRYVLNHEVREDYKYQASVKTATSSEDARAHGQQLSLDEALAFLDDWYNAVTYLPQEADYDTKLTLLFQAQLKRESVEGRLGFPHRQSVEGSTSLDKYNTLKRMLLAIKSGQVPDPLLKEVI